MSTNKTRDGRRDTPLADNEVIAVREYAIKGTLPLELVLIRLGKPTVRASDGKHECGTEIVEGGRVWVRRVIGEDAFEALQLALRLIETDLNHINDQLFPQNSYLAWDNGNRRDLVLPVFEPWPNRSGCPDQSPDH